MISEKIQRKAVTLITLAGSDIDKLRKLVDELDDKEAEEIAWYFSWLINSVKKKKRIKNVA